MNEEKSTCSSPRQIVEGQKEDSHKRGEGSAGGTDGRRPKGPVAKKIPVITSGDRVRFVSHVDTASHPTGCHIWLAGRTPKGYGHFWMNGKTLMAHRVAYALVHPKMDGSKFVLHRCDNPSCVNPNHLFLGTANDNIQDMVSKGRQPKGSLTKKSKLTEVSALQIYQLYHRYKRTQLQLAAKYAVTQAAIWYVVHDRTWTHATNTERIAINAERTAAKAAVDAQAEALGLAWDGSNFVTI